MIGPGMRTDAPRERYDVIIAGARCAGASTALLLARAGLDVLVVDPLPRGRDTLSTHALMRAGVMQLERWGLLDAVMAAGTPPIRTTSFHYADETIEIAIKPGDRIEALYAPRRTVLDPILADAAEAAGAHVLHGCSVVELIRSHDGRVRGAIIGRPDGTLARVRSTLVIGADGIRSKVARLIEAPVLRETTHSAASIYGHWSGLNVEGYHWHFAHGIAAGAIPSNHSVCVFAGMPSHRFRPSTHDAIEETYRDIIRTLDPVLDEALSGASVKPKLRAFAGVPGFIRQSAGPGWALVGDASYFRDPITAHGITDALRDAELVSRAILADTPGALARWQTERDEMVTPMLEVTDRVAAGHWTTEEIKALHLDLSRAMNVTVQRIRELDRAGGVSVRRRRSVAPAGREPPARAGATRARHPPRG
jgi:2-polyprenyl-6-methoxyphenol hydroxylase-like FAD-dependent oxidoreductase